jgi:hypothetical protein
MGGETRLGKIDRRLKDLLLCETLLKSRIGQRVVLQLGANVVVELVTPGRTDAMNRVVPLEGLRDRAAESVLQAALNPSGHRRVVQKHALHWGKPGGGETKRDGG